MKIALTDIGKKYGKHWIFQNVNAVFETGNCYPVIGSNGSGKSTLIQVISGFVTPNKGTINYEMDGTSVAVNEIYEKLVMAAPYLELHEEFNVQESIEMHFQFKKMHAGLTNEDILHKIDLYAHRNKLLGQLSSGMKQRLKLALAVYSNVPLLLLDEPCSNLDVRWSDWLNEELSAYAQTRITLIGSNSQESELRTANQDAIDLTSSLYR